MVVTVTGENYSTVLLAGEYGVEKEATMPQNIKTVCIAFVLCHLVSAPGIRQRNSL
jgi:hypothetical protein